MNLDHIYATKTVLNFFCDMTTNVVFLSQQTFELYIHTLKKIQCSQSFLCRRLPKQTCSILITKEKVHLVFRYLYKTPKFPVHITKAQTFPTFLENFYKKNLAQMKRKTPDHHSIMWVCCSLTIPFYRNYEAQTYTIMTMPLYIECGP